jgi:hypothetical protein
VCPCPFGHRIHAPRPGQATPSGSGRPADSRVESRFEQLRLRIDLGYSRPPVRKRGAAAKRCVGPLPSNRQGDDRAQSNFWRRNRRLAPDWPSRIQLCQPWTVECETPICAFSFRYLWHKYCRLLGLAEVALLPIWQHAACISWRASVVHPASRVWSRIAGRTPDSVAHALQKSMPRPSTASSNCS